MVAVTHLALLGVKKQEAAFWAILMLDMLQMIRGSPRRAALFKLIVKDILECQQERRIGAKLKKGWHEWNKSQRMQLKALICVLGILLILILILGNIIFALIHNLTNKDEEQEQEPEHIPVIEMIHNVWIMETDETGILIFRDGREEKYPYGEIQLPENAREQLADIVLTDGAVTEIAVKTDKINGRVLGADNSYVEIEGYGKIPLTEDCKGYRIYNTLTMCTVGDLSFGYSFTDFVLENGRICGFLMVKEEAMEYIRVLIKTGDYSGIFHQEVILSADADFTVEYGAYDNLKQEEYPAGTEIRIDLNSTYFEGERIKVTPKVLTGKVTLKNVSRSQGIPDYRGHMELLRTEEGIAVINQVLLEEYLYCVVPSEMPASYPDEALKAQAVCARTYAYGRMLKAGYPKYGAHVDDSTSYQVYNNIHEQEHTTTAVKETYGQLLYTAQGGLAETYYYSTSCGVGSDANVWKTEAAKTLDYLKAREISQNVKYGLEAGEALKDEEAFDSFITGKNASDFEVSESWYRWNYQVKKIEAEHIFEVLKQRYQANNKLVLTLEDGEFVSKDVEEFSKVKEMYVSQRGSGGIADELTIETDKNIYKVISEYNIRYVLNDGKSKVVRQDGSEISSPTILPSAFFVLSTSKEKNNVVGYTLCGGGFGHGVGMSQNGAKGMAQCGYTADEILQFFYEACSIRNVYGEPEM